MTMVSEDTLKVKNLPKLLTNTEIEDFLKHFGAIKTKIISPKTKQKSVAYAKFENKEVAREVMFRLHQTYVLKSRLCVEYADREIGMPKIKKIEEQNNQKNKEYFTAFISKLNSFNHSVDFCQPPLPNLKYVYPKANGLTINNIGHALASVPKFYVQVLHLMNRMNLPPPFAVPDPARVPLALAPSQPVQTTTGRTVAAQPETTPSNKASSSESELESDPEDGLKRREIIPQKRSLPQKKSLNKRPKFIKPPVTATRSGKSDRIEEVFDKPGLSHGQQRIEMRLPSMVPEGAEISGHHRPTQPDDDSNSSETQEERTVISEVELRTNQIPEKDLSVIPVFKNYHPGAPTCRLYIKNIAKTVQVKDLEYVYNRYKLTDPGEGADSFEIKLMQEGRMKGQAFVTLSSVELAQKALKETNAFILKEKPLVVMFAKSATAKK